MINDNTKLCFTTGSAFSLIGVHVLNIPPFTNELLHAFIVGMVGGAGGLFVKYLYNKFKK